jgi:cell division protein FtsZ
MRQAEAGMEELRSVVDTLITIPNDRLRQTVDKHMPLSDAFGWLTMYCARQFRESLI